MSALAMINLVILLSAVLAVALTQSMLEERRRWAPFVGLVGQPFWLYITCSWATWGLFACSVLYTCIWLYGAWQQWPRRRSRIAFGEIR